MVIDAVAELSEGRWIPWRAVVAFLLADDRIPGLTRLLRRWAERTGEPPIQIGTLLGRIGLESLPALGVLDLGDAPEETPRALVDAVASWMPDEQLQAHANDVTVRLTARGRAFLKDQAPPIGTTEDEGGDSLVLRARATSTVSAILDASTVAEFGRVEGAELEFVLTADAFARALAIGLVVATLLGRVETVGRVSEQLEALLSHAGEIRGRGTLVKASGFLWIADERVRTLLLSKRTTADCFLEPSPPGGLLVAPGVEFEKIARRSRALGIEVELDGQVLRARPTLPPMPETPRPPSVRPRA